MEFHKIVLPIIKISTIQQDRLGIKKEIPLAKLSANQEWTMNVLKTLDRQQGTKKGLIFDFEWRKNIKKFFEGEMTFCLCELKRLIDSDSKDFNQLNTVPNNVIQKTKELGIMRMGMILDTMAKSVSKDKVEYNQQDLGKYRGMYPLLLTEVKNFKYVYNLLQGEEVKDFDLVQFKEGQRPKPEDIDIKNMKKSGPKAMGVEPLPSVSEIANKAKSQIIQSKPQTAGNDKNLAIPKIPPRKIVKKDDDDDDIFEKRSKVKNADDVLISKSKFNDDSDEEISKKPKGNAQSKKQSLADFKAGLMLDQKTLDKLNKIPKGNSKAKPPTNNNPTSERAENIKVPVNKADVSVSDIKKSPSINNIEAPKPAPQKKVELGGLGGLGGGFKKPSKDDDDEDDPDLKFLRLQKQRREAMMEKKKQEQEEKKKQEQDSKQDGSKKEEETSKKEEKNDDKQKQSEEVKKQVPVIEVENKDQKDEKEDKNQEALEQSNLKEKSKSPKLIGLRSPKSGFKKPNLLKKGLIRQKSKQITKSEANQVIDSVKKQEDKDDKSEGQGSKVDQQQKTTPRNDSVKEGQNTARKESCPTDRSEVKSKKSNKPQIKGMKKPLGGGNQQDFIGQVLGLIQLIMSSQIIQTILGFFQKIDISSLTSKIPLSKDQFIPVITQGIQIVIGGVIGIIVVGAQVFQNHVPKAIGMVVMFVEYVKLTIGISPTKSKNRNFQNRKMLYKNNTKHFSSQPQIDSDNFDENMIGLNIGQVEEVPDYEYPFDDGFKCQIF